MLLWATFDQDSVIVRVKILDSAVATGAGKTGLTSASSGLIISTIADSEATAVAYTVAGSTIETITTLGTYAAPTATKCRFKEMDPTNHPGIYELQFANARFAVAGAKSMIVSIHGASGAAECDATIPLPTVDLFTAITYPSNFSTLAIDGSGQVVAGELGTQAKADMNAEVVDALNVDTYAEPGQGAPAATASIVTKVGFLFKAWRNRHTQTATEYALFADDATTKDQGAAVSDDGTTFNRGEVGTGA